MNQAQKRKKKSAALAVVLAAALALTGTFAWQSISQVARNEAKDVVNPGGRLHDDFSGYNVLGSENTSGKKKRIYVENFTDPDNGGVPIYARVKLTEYMELGEGAGDMNDDGTKAATNKSTPLVADTEINKPSQWPAYYPGKTASEDAFREYWQLTTGGAGWYLPTFNKNKDSLAADINGTLAGGDTGIPYGDYVEIWKNNIETADAYYDADSDTEDEGAGDPTKHGNGGTLGEDYTAQSETHKGTETIKARSMTMDEWIAAGAEAGPYWVFDEEDGWAYWAQPIEPGTATGTVLNSVTQTKTIDDSWYYSINATGQFATAFDWGNTADGTGFYKDGETVSDNGLLVLNTAAGAGYMITTDAEQDKTITYLDRGDSANLKLYVRNLQTVYDNVEWKVKPEEGKTLQAGTKVTGSTLAIDANEPYESKITIEACVPGTDTVIASQKIFVESEGINKLRSIQANSLETANIDGNDWYVIARKSVSNGTEVLLFSKDVLEKQVFSSANDAAWETSDARTYLNGDYINNQASLKELVKETSIYTRNKFTAMGTNEFTETQDKVFFLSEADLTGFLRDTEHTGAVLDAKDFTYDGAAHAAAGTPLVPKIIGVSPADGEGENLYWTRSPMASYTYVPGSMSKKYIVAYHYSAANGLGIRPAMWVTLTN